MYYEYDNNFYKTLINIYLYKQQNVEIQSSSNMKLFDNNV